MNAIKEELKKIKFFPFTNDYVFTKVLTNKPELAEHIQMNALKKCLNKPNKLDFLKRKSFFFTFFHFK